VPVTDLVYAKQSFGKVSWVLAAPAHAPTRKLDAEIRVLAPSSEKAADKTLESLKQTLEEVRIEGKPEVVLDVNLEKVVETSGGSTVVFFPLRFREQQLLGPLDRNVDILLSRMPVVALAVAGQEIDLSAGPEEGEAAEKAAIIDAAADSEKKAEEAERKAAELAEAATRKLSELQSAARSGADSDQRRAAEAAHREADEAAKEAARIAGESRIKAKAAAEVGAAEAPVASGETMDKSEVIGFPASSKPGEK